MTSKRKNIIAFVIIGAIVVLCAAWLLFADNFVSEAYVAEISIDGQVVKQIDLRRAKDETFTLEEYGKNIVLEIKDNAIRFVSSDCPDKVCINTGFVKSEIHPAVCLPNKTAVTLVLQ